MLEADILADHPSEIPISARQVANGLTADRILVVLDDDPTGTQSVSDLPVLTRWEPSDFSWAFQHIRDERLAPAVYVLTNTRSLDEAEASARIEEIVRNALEVAGSARLRLTFVSRGDSTLRGHFPLEPDTIAATVREVLGEVTDGVVIVPAFPEAGRVTIRGTHYCRVTPSGAGAGGAELIPVAETEFARDATFGYNSSSLADYIHEKSGGRIPTNSVIVLTLDTIRAAGDEDKPSIAGRAIADALEPAVDGVAIVADIVTENDLRLLSLGLAAAEARGKRFVYRVGPPFVRARIGQNIRTPLNADEIFTRKAAAKRGGLIVVGSHVGLTSRQLAVLKARHASAWTVEIDVATLFDEDADAYLAGVVEQVGRALVDGDVIVHTSRTLVKADDAAESLAIARTVSAAVVTVVNRTLKSNPPRFVIAKGGITSSDVAAFGLEIRHAVVRGPMLPGLVSLWEAVDGPARGIPYVVFAGNVGDDESLAEVTHKLSAAF